MRISAALLASIVISTSMLSLANRASAEEISFVNSCLGGQFTGLEGTWEVVEIEGIPDSVGGPTGVDGQNSTWSFSAGIHDWFFFFDREPFFFDVSASGPFSLSGGTLFATGMSLLTGSDSFVLTVQGNQISFLDDEGDRWTYCKAGICGNGTVDPGEECDDGNTDPCDGCSPLCVIVPDSDSDGIDDACECGDISGDGFVNTIDARLIQRCAVGEDLPGICSNPLCDTTGEGVCNTIDARLVQRFSVGELTKDDLRCSAKQLGTTTAPAIAPAVSGSNVFLASGGGKGNETYITTVSDRNLVPSISFGGLALLGALVLAIAVAGLAMQRRRRAQ